MLSGDFYEWQGASFEFGFSVLLICECMSCTYPKISECIWKYSEMSLERKGLERVVCLRRSEGRPL